MKTLLPNVLTAIVLLLIPLLSFGQLPNLGASSGFALFTAAGPFTNNGATQVSGDIGINGGAFSGFPPGTLIGAVHLADPTSAQAASDLTKAYGELSNVTCGATIGTTLGNGQTLTPNVYCLGAASSVNGQLILDGGGNPGAIFIFKIEGALSTSPLANIVLINGASVCNVYWQINGSFRLGERARFAGTILVEGTLNFLEGASMIGRALSTQGISLNNNMITGLSPTPSIITNSGSNTLCAGDSMVLSGNQGGTWSTGATTPTITVTTSGDYFVTNTAPCGSVESNHIKIIVNSLPSCTIVGSDVICPSQTTQLCASLAGALDYWWITGAQTQCIDVATAGTYSVTVTDANGCKSECSKIITPRGIDTCLISGESVICPGQTTQLCVPIADVTDYWWITGAQTRCIDVSTAGTYSITITDANGCKSECSKIVTMSEAATCQITGESVICPGQTTQLCSSLADADDYWWITGAQTRCIDVSTAGTYSVTVTDANGCKSECSKIVTMSEVATCQITGESVICPGQTTQLCAPLGDVKDYWWITGAQTRCIDVTTAGTYSITITDANGCKSECSKIVTMSEGTTCQITSRDASCEGQPTQLCGPSGAMAYAWSNGATTSCIDVSSAATYSLTVTYAGGCVSTCSKTVTNTPDSCLITGYTIICQGQSTRLCSPVEAIDYWWSTGEQTQCIDVISPGTYALTLTTKGECKRFCSIVVVLAGPAFNCEIKGVTTICSGQNTQLCVPLIDDGAYLWSNGSTTACITVSNAGTYSVTVTNAVGCVSTCSTTVKVLNSPPSEITGDLDLCVGQRTQLCAPTFGGRFLWSTGSINQCIFVNQAGEYSVTITNSSGCVSTPSVTVKINALPACAIAGNFTLNEGQSTELCAPSGMATYLWNTGSTDRCITTSKASWHSVTITDSSGCVTTCSQTLTLVPAACTITGKDTICQGDSTELCATRTTSAQFLWSTGATTACIKVASTGTYTLTTTQNGITRTCSKIVTVKPALVCTITGNINPGEGTLDTLCGPAGMASYRWSSGATTQCITLSSYGTYTLTVTNSNACTSTCSVVVSDANTSGVTPADRLDVAIYPNPFSTKAVITFQNTQSNKHLLIELCSLTGNKLVTLFEGAIEKDVMYKTELNAANWAAGMYYCRIVYGREIIYRKIILIRE